MNFLDTILNIIFPARCIACGEGDNELCKNCFANSPLAVRETEDWVFPMFDYRHIPIKKSIWLLKYKGRKKIAEIFADVMYGRMIEELSELSLMKNFNKPLLIPIPLSKKRYRERGYNQALLICEELMDIDRKNNKNSTEKNFELGKNILIKTKETEHQANIKERKDRLKNLSGSFHVKKEDAVKGRNVILIDDVTTTSATLHEAKKILKQSGAKNIIAFTVAH